MLVVCPKCGSNLQARKIMILTNRNAIKCDICSSRLRVKNKDFTSKIGGWGGGIGAFLNFFPFYLLLRTGNLVYLALLVPLISAELLIVFLFMNKYVALQAEEPKHSSKT